jgi:hypothetical protein
MKNKGGKDKGIKKLLIGAHQTEESALPDTKKGHVLVGELISSVSAIGAKRG